MGGAGEIRSSSACPTGLATLLGHPVHPVSIGAESNTYKSNRPVKPPPAICPSLPSICPSLPSICSYVPPSVPSPLHPFLHPVTILATAPFVRASNLKEFL
eukprot:349875-Chlamydomonas_euryale.AAC.2